MQSICPKVAFNNIRFLPDFAEEQENDRGTEIHSKKYLETLENVHLFFDFSVPNIGQNHNTLNIWVAPVHLDLGLGGLNIVLRHIAIIKLKVTVCLLDCYSSCTQNQ